jgi:hypothetical protein
MYYNYIKGEMQRFWVIDFIALLDNAKNQIYKAQRVTVYL